MPEYLWQRAGSYTSGLAQLVDRMRYVLYGKHRRTTIDASASARRRSTAFSSHPGKPTLKLYFVLLVQSNTSPTAALYEDWALPAPVCQSSMRGDSFAERVAANHLQQHSLANQGHTAASCSYIQSATMHFRVL